MQELFDVFLSQFCFYNPNLKSHINRWSSLGFDVLIPLNLTPIFHGRRYLIFVLQSHLPLYEIIEMP